MRDEFKLSGDTATGSARNGKLLVKSDTVDVARVTKALYVGGAGDVVVRHVDDDPADPPVTYKAVPAGTTLFIAIRRLMNATAATDIIGQS